MTTAIPLELTRQLYCQWIHLLFKKLLFYLHLKDTKESHKMQGNFPIVYIFSGLRQCSRYRVVNGMKQTLAEPLLFQGLSWVLYISYLHQQAWIEPHYHSYSCHPFSLNCKVLLSKKTKAPEPFHSTTKMMHTKVKRKMCKALSKLSDL